MNWFIVKYQYPFTPIRYVHHLLLETLVKTWTKVQWNRMEWPIVEAQLITLIIPCFMLHAGGELLTCGDPSNSALGRPAIDVPGSRFGHVALDGVQCIAAGGYHCLAMTSEKVSKTWLRYQIETIFDWLVGQPPVNSNPWSKTAKIYLTGIL